MKKRDQHNQDAPREELSLDTLLLEKQALSQQVKRLIRAEGKLYEYQQHLDDQLKEYKGLYDLNRRLNGSFNMQNIFQETVSYVVQQLDFERAVFLRKDEGGRSYRACAWDGYYQHSEEEAVSRLTIDADTPWLAPLAARDEHLICRGDSPAGELTDCRARLGMHEFFVYPLGFHSLPHALLVVGNTEENASFYRRVDDSPGALLSMGNLVGLVSSQLDNHIFLEKMEQAREQERLAEAKYRNLFENAAEGIFQRTPEGRYLAANPSLARMLGYASPAELMAEVTDVSRLHLDAQKYAEMMGLLEAHDTVQGFEAQMLRRDGSAFWVSLSIRLVRDDQGRLLYFEGMAEEISERKRAEEALRESERKYRQLSEALEQRVREAVDELRQKDKILILQGRQAVMGEMISNIAHQWRQPLNMLALLVQDLQMTQKKEGLSEAFVEANVKRSLEIIGQMSKTIDYFRYFFQPETERVEFRVLDTIQKTLLILEGSLNVHGIRTELVHSGDPAVNGYPTEFVQVLLNILINARDALITAQTQAPLIQVRVAAENGKTVVSISDNAGGIPEEILDKVFDPYFTTKGPEQGTGIGLFMSKTIIEKNMHGRLTVRNLAEGAEFRIEV
jgi:PAS domain S-box-containing protein